MPVALADDGTPTTPEQPAGEDSPYQRIAADLRGAIVSGILRPGEQLPTLSDLTGRYSVSVGTAQRAIAQLRAAGLVTVSRGRRAVVSDSNVTAVDSAEVVSLDVARKSAK